jgi:hypothetical protein
MDSLVCLTLIDITNTDVKRGESKERDQQRNWETVLQVLGLKTQPIILEGPVVLDDVRPGVFGEFYEDKHRIWAFSFTSDTEVYNLEQLAQDFEQVPIILGLDETARFMLPIFHSYGTLKNVHFFLANTLNIT